MLYYKFEKNHPELQIGKIICLARNYRKHADEMNAKVTKDPLVFLKPSSAVVYNNESIIIPSASNCLHHEVELGIVISKTCSRIKEENAMDYVLGYLIGLDITARDIQSEAKKQGWPWSIPKGFDTFAPISNVVLKNDVSDPNNLDLDLKVNSVVRQSSNTKYMVHSVERIIAFLSDIMTLYEGDLILTGTPEGVAEIVEGDVLDANLQDICSLHVDVKKQ